MYTVNVRQFNMLETLHCHIVRCPFSINFSLKYRVFVKLNKYAVNKNNVMDNNKGYFINYEICSTNKNQKHKTNFLIKRLREIISLKCFKEITVHSHNDVYMAQ